MRFSGRVGVSQSIGC